MISHRILGVIVCMLAVLASARGAEIGFVERYSLADERAAVLDQLIPGTEEYYFYHCLHAQQTGDRAEYDRLMALWIERHGYTEQVNELQNRQALLDYEERPRESLDHVIDVLDLQYNHARRLTDQVPTHPTRLDPELLSIENLTRQAFERYTNLQGIEDAGLDILDHARLNEERRRDLLSRLSRPDIPDLPRLVAADLQARNSGGFGSLEIHRKLTRRQLDACRQLLPKLADETAFVRAYLTKLAPGDMEDLEHDRGALRRYLEQLDAYAADLSPAHDSLKAQILYRLLDLDRREGLYDRDRFIRYLQYPRVAPYMAPNYVADARRRGLLVNLSEDYSAFARLPPVGQDEELVRDYLAHFLVDDPDYRAFASMIRDDYLRDIFVETKIVNGLGDTEQWASMLAPARYQELKDRIDLEFALDNPEQFGAEAPVSLDLYVKNVETLLVKVFKINAFNYYQGAMRELNTAIDLDGLLATHEETLRFSEPPVRRIRRTLDFPQCQDPGLYVIEFIGNGVSSRAVVRKGQLRAIEQPGPAGHEFSVLDQDGRPRPSATLWVDGREYRPGEDGVIIVPYSTSPGNRTAILRDGDLSSLTRFLHRAETYALAAAVHVDRESLLKDQQAQVLIRPALSLHGRPVSVNLLEDIRLTVQSVDQDGVSARTEIEDFELSNTGEATYTFRVPDNLARLDFTLRAKIENVSRGDQDDVADSASFSVNGSRASLHTDDLYLSMGGGDYRIEVLGRNGEPKPNRVVHCEIQQRYFRDPVRVSLRSDRQGQILLGPLTDVSSVQAVLEGGATRRWTPAADRYAYPASIHGVAGVSVRVPYTGPANPAPGKDFTLLEVRSGSYVADHSEAVRLRGGFLELPALPAGGYELVLKRRNEVVRVVVAEGEERNGLWVSADSALERLHATPIHIAALTRADTGDVRISLAHATPTTRVHVFATRFVPDFDAFDNLWTSPLSPSFHRFTPPISQYVAGRNIGDEYRYVLDRRFAPLFPGVMLTRPGLLLNPWSVRKTDTEAESLEEGSAFGMLDAAAAPAASAARSLAERFSAPGRPIDPTYDFLTAGSLILSNLRPDADGMVTVPAEDLEGYAQIHVLAVDALSTAIRTLSLPTPDLDTRDLTHLSDFDAEDHVTEQKLVSKLEPGQTLTLEDVTTSSLEVYDSLDDVYRLYQSLNDDPNLREFAFVLRWPTFDAQQKLETYSKYACHELNLFLAFKDPEFFESVVVPYLANKRDKTFLDLWLLQDADGLSGYLEPWAFQRLNAVERILLAQRGPADPDLVAAHIRDLDDLIPPDPEEFLRRFRTALQGRALDASDKLGLGDAIRGGVALRRMESDAKALGTQVPEEETLSALFMDLEGAGGRAGEDFSRAELSAQPMPAMQAGTTVNFFAERVEQRERTRTLFRQADRTEEWAENNYYKLPIEDQVAALIPVNAFWRDFARHAPGEPFRSTEFLVPTRNFSEMMLALAVLDLPFDDPDHQTTTDGRSFSLTAGGPALVVHEEIRPGEIAQDPLPILVSQQFFRSDDRYRYEGNERFDKFIRDEFLAWVPYASQVTLTNPTSARQKLRVLLQIPRGAMPLQNGFYSRGIPVTLEPYAVQTLEYHFYFPATGEFPIYPAQIARDEAFVAAAEAFSFHVVDRLSAVDTQSWDYVSQQGSESDVLEFLSANNPHRLDLAQIAWRMRDRAFFLDTLRTLDRRHVFAPVLWSYALHHNEPDRAREFLRQSPMTHRCGLFLESPLLNVDPVATHAYQHLEYAPYINARAHQVGQTRTIRNNRFHEQYDRFLHVLRYKPRLSHEDSLAAAYYLFLQDRTPEALAWFDRVDREQIAETLQYDYLAVYAAMVRGETEAARTLAATRQNTPVTRWRHRFEEALAQLDEIAGASTRVVDPDSREQQQTGLAATEPSLDFKVEAREIRIAYQNLDACRIDIYPMDVELLFSRSPFVQQDTSRFAYIQPRSSIDVDLPNGSGEQIVPLPTAYHSSNVMIDIVAGGIRKSQAYYANTLAIQLIENYGQVLVRAEGSLTPMPTTYVKVYARMQDGSVQFYKDGYTDLRGRFDYASLSTDDLDRVERFAILILHPEGGAVIREATPPPR